MSFLDDANRLAAACGGGYLSPTAVRELTSSEMNLEQVMLELIALAKTLSQPSISNFQVGAVARGISGALYLGANLEFVGGPLQFTVHAEQAAVINAALHGETGLAALAISAPPCGYCRQFLYELATASELEILLAGEPPSRLIDFLPGAFGPADLGVLGGLLAPSRHVVRLAASSAIDRHSAAVDLAVRGAQLSYAPYTGAVGAVALTTEDGRILVGPYLENAAFNPSISPVQAAAVALVLAGRRMNEVVRATVVARAGSAIDHVGAARRLLEHAAPAAIIEECVIEVESFANGATSEPVAAEVEKGTKPARAKRNSDKDLSFYFFDFDDNIMFVETPILIRDKKTKKIKKVSTAEFAKIRGNFGKPGKWKDFEVYDDTYSHFRDIAADKLKPKEQQHFVEDVTKAIRGKPEMWQRPSWPLFVHACTEQRPVAIVTARGHSPETLQAGVRVLREKKLIPHEPNYLAVYAVGNSEVAAELLAGVKDADERRVIDALPDKTSALKRLAIRQAVDRALEEYGCEPEHRFGMSDDDPLNVDLIVKAMCDCKKKYPDKRFFVINTHEGEWVKLEVFPVNFPVTKKVAPSEIVG
jgi:homodimeric cytidine deaminase